MALSVGKNVKQIRVWDLPKPQTTIGELREEETDQEVSDPNENSQRKSARIYQSPVKVEPTLI